MPEGEDGEYFARKDRGLWELDCTLVTLFHAVVSHRGQILDINSFRGNDVRTEEELHGAMTIQQSIDARKRCDSDRYGDGDAQVVVGGKRDRCKN
jgi:hypothetical protein